MINKEQEHKKKQTQRLNEIIDLLSKRAGQGGKTSELQSLVPFFKEIQFIKENKEISNTDLMFICERVKLVQMNKGQFVCHYGDVGKEFYIILKGSISVLVPRRSTQQRTSILSKQNNVDLKALRDQMQQMKGKNDTFKKQSTIGKIYALNFKKTIKKLESRESSQDKSIDPVKEQIDTMKTDESMSDFADEEGEQDKSDNLNERSQNDKSQNDKSQSSAMYGVGGKKAPYNITHANSSFNESLQNKTLSEQAMPGTNKNTMDTLEKEQSIKMLAKTQANVSRNGSRRNSKINSRQNSRANSQLSEYEDQNNNPQSHNSAHLERVKTLIEEDEKYRLVKWAHTLSITVPQALADIIEQIIIESIPETEDLMRNHNIKSDTSSTLNSPKKMNFDEESYHIIKNNFKESFPLFYNRVNWKLVDQRVQNSKLKKSGTALLANNNKQETMTMIMKHMTGEDSIQAAILGPGQSFGEYSLINSKPRTAHIKCLEDCFFAVLDKEDYNQSLKRIEANRIQKVVDFLRNLPQFKHWTKTSMSKLQYFFQKKYFEQGNQVFRENMMCEYVYIVWSGEFEQSKIIDQYEHKNLKDNEINLYGFLGPNSSIKDKSLSLKGSQIKQRKTKIQQKIRIFGPGQVIGDADAVKLQNYSTSLKCVSNNGGVLLSIKTTEFLQRVKVNQESWRIIKQNISAQEKQTSAMIKSKTSKEEYLKINSQQLVKNELNDQGNKGQTDNQQELNSSNLFYNLEFKKYQFWDIPLSEKEHDNIFCRQKSNQQQVPAPQNKDKFSITSPYSNLNNSSIAESSIAESSYQDEMVIKTYFAFDKDFLKSQISSHYARSRLQIIDEGANNQLNESNMWQSQKLQQQIQPQYTATNNNFCFSNLPQNSNINTQNSNQKIPTFNQIEESHVFSNKTTSRADPEQNIGQMKAEKLGTIISSHRQQEKQQEPLVGNQNKQLNSQDSKTSVRNILEANNYEAEQFNTTQDDVGLRNSTNQNITYSSQKNLNNLIPQQRQQRMQMQKIQANARLSTAIGGSNVKQRPNLVTSNMIFSQQDMRQQTAHARRNVQNRYTSNQLTSSFVSNQMLDQLHSPQSLFNNNRKDQSNNLLTFTNLSVNNHQSNIATRITTVNQSTRNLKQMMFQTTASKQHLSPPKSIHFRPSASSHRSGLQRNLKLMNKTYQQGDHLTSQASSTHCNFNIISNGAFSTSAGQPQKKLVQQASTFKPVSLLEKKPKHFQQGTGSQQGDSKQTQLIKQSKILQRFRQRQEKSKDASLEK